MSTTPSKAPPRGAISADRLRAGQELHAPTPAEQRTARIMGAWFLGTLVIRAVAEPA